MPRGSSGKSEGHVNIDNLVWNSRSADSMSGTCAIRGHALELSLDRSDAERALLTIRAPGGSLPLDLVGISPVSLEGISFPVQPVDIDGGTTVLQGHVPAAAAASVFAPPGTPLSPDVSDPDASDPVVSLSRQHAAAKRERRQHADRVKDLRSKAVNLRAQLDEVNAELSTAGEKAGAIADRCADLRQQLRDALDAEEV